MSYFYNLFLFIMLSLSVNIYAEYQKDELKFKTTTSCRFAYPNKRITFFIRIENVTDRSIKAKIIYKIPNELSYMSTNTKGLYFPKRKNASHSFFRWNITILAKKIIIIKIKVRAVKTNARLSNEFRLLYLGKQEKDSCTIRVAGCCGATNISTYDTDDPSEVGQETTYVVFINNESAQNITMLNVVNDIPKQMRFLRAELTINKEKKKIQYTYDAIKRKVLFAPIKILHFGEKAIYKIHCLAIKEGLAKNTVRLNYHEFDKEIIDEEGTSVYR